MESKSKKEQGGATASCVCIPHVHLNPTDCTKASKMEGKAM